MIGIQMKNDKGFSLIEMMIAAAMSIVLLGAAVYTYTKQDKVLRTENRSLQTRDYARLAMDRVSDDLLRAGYGFPPGDSNNNTLEPARGFITTNVTSLSYRVNSDDVSAYVNANAIETSTCLFVPSTTGFAVDDRVVFFDVETPSKWNTKDVVTMGATGLCFGTGSPARLATAGGADGGCDSATVCDGTYNPILDNVAVEINKYHRISYSYDATAQTISVTDDQGNTDATDDTTTIIANRISSLAFTYYDVDGAEVTPVAPRDATVATDIPFLGRIRKIQIDITAVDDNDSTITARLLTDINLRNMGI